jgi:uncharacterized protein
MTHNEVESCFDASPYLKLFIDKDGRWFQNGAEIIHQKIYRQFCEMLEKVPDGGYQVRLGREICAVEVEDAPFVVLTVFEEPDGSLTIEMNDGVREAFDPAFFWIGAENVPYCKIRGGNFHARFSRPAYYQVARYIVPDNNREFHLIIKGKRFPVKRISDESA